MLVYNHAPYVEQAVTSILRQRTDLPFELLIGEDHSSDNSRAIVEDLQRRHPSVVRVVSSPDNVGMHENMARLVRACRAPLMAVCEGDDYWSDPDKLTRQFAVLSSRPDTVAVHSEFSHIIWRSGAWRRLPRYWRSRGIVIPQGWVFDELLTENFIQTCTLMIRTEIAADYLASGLPTSTYAVGDWPLCIFASRFGRIDYIDEPLATYRRVPGSATNQGAAAEVRRARDAVRMVSDFARWADVRADVETAGHVGAMRHVLRNALHAGDVESAHDAYNWLVKAPGGLVGLERVAAKIASRSESTARAFSRMAGVRRSLLQRSRYRDVDAPWDRAAY